MLQLNPSKSSQVLITNLSFHGFSNHLTQIMFFEFNEHSLMSSFHDVKSHESIHRARKASERLLWCSAAPRPLDGGVDAD